jgi:hypothetical protein
MQDEELTLVQRCVLVTLMIKATALPNTLLRNEARIELKADKRRDLEKRGLITVTQRPLVLELTDKGWGRAKRELGADVPPGAGAKGGTLYVVLGFLHDYLEHTGMAPAELFSLRGEAAPAATADATLDLEARIRKAYGALAPRAGAYIMLAKLRAALGGVSKTKVDAALVQMDRAPDVHLIPESNQKVLTPEERAAAVSIGNQDKHLIAIGS